MLKFFQRNIRNLSCTNTGVLAQKLSGACLYPGSAMRRKLSGNSKDDLCANGIALDKLSKNGGHTEDTEKFYDSFDIMRVSSRKEVEYKWPPMGYRYDHLIKMLSKRDRRMSWPGIVTLNILGDSVLDDDCILVDRNPCRVAGLCWRIILDIDSQFKPAYDTLFFLHGGEPNGYKNNLKFLSSKPKELPEPKVDQDTIYRLCRSLSRGYYLYFDGFPSKLHAMVVHENNEEERLCISDIAAEVDKEDVLKGLSPDLFCKDEKIEANATILKMIAFNCKQKDVTFAIDTNIVDYFKGNFDCEMSEEYIEWMVLNCDYKSLELGDKDASHAFFKGPARDLMTKCFKLANGGDSYSFDKEFIKSKMLDYIQIGDWRNRIEKLPRAQEAPIPVKACKFVDENGSISRAPREDLKEDASAAKTPGKRML